MRLKLFLTFIFASTGLFCFSQAPQHINYQGAARVTNGSVLSNTTISVKVDLYDAAIGGALKFSETHSSVNTNEFGLFNIKIGSVNTTNFPTINWSTGNYFIETTVTFGGVSSTLSPRQQLSSVPYALFAGSDWASGSGNIFPKNISDKVSIGTLTTTASRLGVTENSSSVPSASITQLDPNGNALVVGVSGPLNTPGNAAIFNGRVINKTFTQLGSTAISGNPEICPKILVFELDSAIQKSAMAAFPTLPKTSITPGVCTDITIGSVASSFTSPKVVSKNEILGVEVFVESKTAWGNVPPFMTEPTGYHFYYAVVNEPITNFAVIRVCPASTNSSSVTNKYFKLKVTIKHP